MRQLLGSEEGIEKTQHSQGQNTEAAAAMTRRKRREKKKRKNDVRDVAAPGKERSIILSLFERREIHRRETNVFVFLLLTRFSAH